MTSPFALSSCACPRLTPVNQWWFRAVVTALTLLFAAALADAQLLTTSCGGNGDSACSVFTTEFWANDSGSCDRGLKSSASSAKALGGSGVCENDNRSTQAYSGAWVQWALDQQRRYIGGNVPLNRNLTLGTHNSYSSYADGDDNMIGTNQGYSLTDQLNLGARHLRLDPVYYFGEYRLCHTNADDRTCGALAAEEYAPLATVLAPLLPGINILVPPPIPEVVDAGLAGVAIYSVATNHKDGIAINNRLFVSAIREIADWLKLHPTEFITVGMNFADGQEETIGPDIAKIISTYMVNAQGQSIVYTGDDFASNNLVWPSLNDFKKMVPARQIAFGTDDAMSFDPQSVYSWTIYQSQTRCDPSKNALGTCDHTEYPGISTSGHSPTLPDRNLNFYSCALSGWEDPLFPISDFFTYFPNGSVRTSEGRTGSDYVGSDFTGLVGENEVVEATTCGYSAIDFDFFMSLGQAFGPYATSNPDKRREASIWSWEENDYGAAGVAAMDLTLPASTDPYPTTIAQGRWKGVSPLANYAYACADKSTSQTYPKTWTVVRGGPGFDFYDGPIACGARVFSYPENALDNKALLKAALSMQNPPDYIFLRTGPNGLVPPAATSGEPPIELYMDQGGPAPDPATIAVDGVRELKFYPVQQPQPNDPFIMLNLGNLGSPTNPIPLDGGPVNLLMGVLPEIAELLPPGNSGFGSDFTVDLYSTSATGAPVYQPYPEGVTPATGAASLHVLVPTATTLSSTPQSPGSLDYILRAEVEPTCGPPEAENGITGVVTFTDTYSAPGEKVKVTQLGWAAINNSSGGESSGSELPLVNCPDGTATDNVICVGVPLPAGRHSLVAQYHYDSLYNSSASNADVFTAGDLVVTPATLLFDLRVSNPALEKSLTFATIGQATGPIAVVPDAGYLQVSGTGTNYQVTLKPDPRWTPGMYNTTVTVGTATNSQKVPVDIIVPGPLSVDQSTLTFSSTNQGIPDPQTIQVSYEGGPLQVTAPDAPWMTLQVIPSAVTTRQSTTAQIVVGANPAGVPDGPNVGTILISQPGAATSLQVQVKLIETITSRSVTIKTSPANLDFVCNRTTYKAPYTFLSPTSPFYCEGSTVVQTIAPGTRALFSGWQDGFQGPVRLIDTTKSQTLKVLYRKQNEVSVTVNPACSGTVLPSHSWYNPGTEANLAASPAPNYKFVNYSGDLSSTNAQTAFSVSQPVNLVANFTCPNCDILTSRPAAFNLGAHLTIDATVVGANLSDRIQFMVDPSLPDWLTATPTSATTPANLKVTANISDLEAGNHNTTITLHPIHLAAGVRIPDLNIPVTLGLVDVAVDSAPSGLLVSVDHVSYTTPAQFKWVSGTPHLLDGSVQIAGMVKYVPGTWSDGGLSTHQVTAPAPGAAVKYVENFAPSYQLSLKADPPGGGTLSVVNPSADNFYPGGSLVRVEATANPGFRFAEFSGSVSGSANPVSLTVNGGVLEFANFNSSAGPAMRVVAPSQLLALPLSNNVSGVFQLTNTSTSGIGNVRVTGVDSFQTLVGTGGVSLASQSSSFIAALPPGGALPFLLQFDWPPSAQTVQMTVHFTGDGGAYTGATRLVLTR